MMEKIFENLEKAEKIIQTANHLLGVTYPLMQDKNLLLKILTETKKGVSYCINAILQYEYLYGRIQLSTNPKDNFTKFIEKCCPKYKISQTDSERIKELFKITKKHKESPLEFAKQDKIVILSEHMEIETITLEKIKEFLNSSKKILEKTKSTILR